MKQEPYNNFWQKIHKSARSKNFPLRVMFELTYRCNFFCRHCYVPFSYRKNTKKRELGTKGVFSILDQLRDAGCFYLGFTGGEPFTRGDFRDILWYAKKCGFEIIIYTNGSLIDKQMALELARLAPNKIDITIPAMSKEAFKRICGVSGYRDKVFKAVALLHKNGVNLGFKTCILKYNESEIDKIRDFADSLDAFHRLDGMLSRRLNGSKEPYKYRGGIIRKNLKDSNQKFKYSKMINRNLKDCNSEITDYHKSNGDLFKCGVGISQAAITPFGELKMCLMIDYPKYKILDTSLREAWPELRDLVSSIKPDNNYHCNSCGLRVYCEWCPAKAWLKDKNFTTCDSESKRWASLRALLKEGRHKNNINTYAKTYAAG